MIASARLAQLVERKALNLVVVGSSPTVGIPFCDWVFLRASVCRRAALDRGWGAHCDYNMTLVGLEPTISGSVDRCLIHWATGPQQAAATVSPGRQSDVTQRRGRPKSESESPLRS